MSEKTVNLETMMPLMLEQIENGGRVRFTPNGTSMRPMLEGGRDQVILSALPTKLKKYDLPLYRRKNGQFVLHRVVKVGDTYTCVGDNQFALESGLAHDQMLALVCGFIRNGREYSVNSLSYRLYCLFWHFTRPLRGFFRRGVGFIRRRLSKGSH